MAFCMTYNMVLGRKGHARHSLPCWSRPCKECKCRQANWFDPAGCFKNLWYSQSLQTLLEAPPVRNQRNRTILDPCLPLEPVTDGGFWRRGIRISPRSLLEIPGFGVRTNPVPCLHQWPALWAVITGTSLCRWHGRVTDSIKRCFKQIVTDYLCGRWDTEFGP